MRNRIYAIFLLLSFLVVLSHEMIPHHHEDLALNISHSNKHDGIHKHHHHRELGHQHNNHTNNEEKSSEHNHPLFPFHQHFSTSNDIYTNRTSLLHSNTQIQNILFIAYFEFCRIDILKPPNLKVDFNKEPPFLISTICNLVAFSLRGPPTIF